MFHPLSLFIGLRYTKAKRKNHFISFISVVSVGGIALGITTMIVVLSVMNGFQQEVKDRSLAMTAHATIQNAYGASIEDWHVPAEIAKKNSHVLGTAPFINGQGLVSYQNVVKPLQIQGIDPSLESNVSDIAQKMRPAQDNLNKDATKNSEGNEQKALTQGEKNGDYGYGKLTDLKAGEFGIILGKSLADNIGARIGDKVSLITSDINVTAVGVTPRVKRMTVIGFFEIGIYEYDSTIALIHIEDAAKLFRFPEGSVQGVRLKINDLLHSRTIAQELANALPVNDDYTVSDWTAQFAALFRMIQIEKLSMTVIMSLIVAVAVFNVVSTLIMTVTDKRADIAILRTLGMSPKQIMGIFTVQGVVIGILGTLIGVILGLSIALNLESIIKSIEELFNQRLFEPSVYPISNIPSLVYASDVMIVAGISFLMASLATLYPAWKAARTQPAEALRYE